MLKFILIVLFHEFMSKTTYFLPALFAVLEYQTDEMTCLKQKKSVEGFPTFYTLPHLGVLCLVAFYSVFIFFVIKTLCRIITQIN